MINVVSNVEQKIEVLDSTNGASYYEGLAVRYSNTESKLVSAVSEEELLDKIFSIAAEITGASISSIKEQQNDDLEDAWMGKGQYQVVFKLYNFGLELVIDVINIDTGINMEVPSVKRGEGYENY
jgi:hypothetical protein